MLGFSPFKKRANKFNYIPRYYDPEKEVREQRRAELHGERSDSDTEYKVGKYIRTQRDARAARYEEREGQGRKKVLYMVCFVVLAAVFIFAAYPKLISLLETSSKTKAKVEQSEDAFDPHAPIVVVPNDYVEEK